MARILVIDDDEGVRSLVTDVLTEVGYEVAAASDGAMGLDFCRHAAPDLVITDLVMPEKEGIETIVAIRREFPRAKVIAMSGSGKELLSAAQHLGAAVTLPKPLAIPRLLEAVLSLVGSPPTAG